MSKPLELIQEALTAVKSCSTPETSWQKRKQLADQLLGLFESWFKSNPKNKALHWIEKGIVRTFVAWLVDEELGRNS